MGLFLSRDPVEGVLNRPMSLNGYSYVEGNPVNLTDPSGEFPFLFAVAVIAGALFTGTIVGAVTLAVWDITTNQHLSLSPFDDKFFLNPKSHWNQHHTQIAVGLGGLIGGGTGLAVGLATLSPIGGIAGAFTNTVGGAIGGHRSGGELAVDALIGGAFGGLFGALVPGPQGLFSQTTFTSSAGSVTLETAQSSLLLKIGTGGTLNMLQGMTSRLTRNRLFDAGEAITPGNLLLDFSVGAITTGVFYGSVGSLVKGAANKSGWLTYISKSESSNILNDVTKSIANSRQGIIGSNVLGTNLVGGLLSSKPLLPPEYYQRMEQLYNNSLFSFPILQ